MCNIHSKEQIIQEFALDGAVTQVRLEVVGRVCYHSNATGCPLCECFCFNKIIRTWLLVHSAYKQHICDHDDQFSYRARKSHRTLQNKVRIKVFPEQ